MTDQPNLIQGTLYREGLQYYLQQPVGGKHAIRMLDVHGVGINRSQIGKRFEAIPIRDPDVIVPEGFAAYCFRLKEVT